MTTDIHILNGPNLDRLGTREPSVYGTTTLRQIEAACRDEAVDAGIVFRQSNMEGELVGWIQQARGTYKALIVNAGAYTHSSIAILDALAAADLPVIEVHLSNIFRREAFRHRSYISTIARGMVCGFGGFGYELALEAAAELLNAPAETRSPGCP